MDISIIIVSWKVREKLRTNLSALLAAQGSLHFEIFVVDNDSQDGTVEMLKEEFPSVCLIANDSNRGFAAANNQALKLAKGRFILLLNPDMQVEAGTLADILAWAEKNPQATVCGCQLLGTDGKIIRQVRRFPRFFDQLLITWKIPHLFPATVSGYLQTGFDYGQAAKVDSIRGAFFLINREAYRQISGGREPFLDERYFLWFEEVDFCREVYKLGGEVWYTPAARCRDYVGQSFSQVRRPQAQEYFRRSMLEYFKKWGKKWEYQLLRAAWSLVRLAIR